MLCFLGKNYLIYKMIYIILKNVYGGVVPGLKKYFKSRIDSFPYANFPKLIKGGLNNI